MQHRPRHPGFTLIEMLVVVGIIVATIGVAIPTLNIMREGAAMSVGVGAVQVAAATARGYSNRTDRSFLTDLVPDTTAANEKGVYSGYAALFTPAGEIRIVENYEGAFYRDGYPFPLERLDWQGDFNAEPGTTPPPGFPASNGNGGDVPRHLNGFLDGPIIEGAIEYLGLPSDSGVAGVLRTAASGVPTLVPPPFAVWFDGNGQLVTGDASQADRCIYYDGNYNGSYEIGLNRFSTTYDPRVYDPTSAEFNRSVAIDGDRYVVPFEQIETVVGVWVYSKDAFNSSGLAAWTDMSGGANQARWDWLVENGELVMFSVQAGTPMRSSDQ